jgi:ABC-type uncharacterized transport system auxiliary subunit
VISVRRLIVLLVLAAGCIHGRIPPLEQYRLRIPDTSVASLLQFDGNGHELRPAGDLAIVPYLAPGLYGSRGIVFRIGENQYGSYPNREWAVPVSTMLGMITEDLLRAHPVTLGPAVFDPPSPHSYTYIWRGVVRELEEVNRGPDVYAAVRLDARLVRARDDSILWVGSARLEQKVPSGTMPAIVDALSRLTTEAILQLVDGARATLAQPTVGAHNKKP